jgi:hypothetical protein
VTAHTLPAFADALPARRMRDPDEGVRLRAQALYMAWTYEQLAMKYPERGRGYRERANWWRSESEGKR